MFEWINDKFLCLQVGLLSLLRDMKEDETGASDMVTVLLIVLVVVGVAFLFRKSLINLVNDVFNAIDIGGLSAPA